MTPQLQARLDAARIIETRRRAREGVDRLLHGISRHVGTALSGAEIDDILDDIATFIEARAVVRNPK